MSGEVNFKLNIAGAGDIDVVSVVSNEGSARQLSGLKLTGEIRDIAIVWPWHFRALRYALRRRKGLLERYHTSMAPKARILSCTFDHESPSSSCHQMHRRQTPGGQADKRANIAPWGESAEVQYLPRQLQFGSSQHRPAYRIQFVKYAEGRISWNWWKGRRLHP